MPDQVETETVSPTVADPPVGALVAGRYRVERLLDLGGISAVYLARDEQVASRRVALKVLRETSASSDWLRAKLLDEMRALARLHHPNVVSVTDFGALSSGQPFLVMEYLPGPTLRSRLAEGELPLEEAVAILLQLGHALAAAHAAGIIHRDLKPENVILQETGGEERQAKVIDFGLATIRASLETPAETTRVAGTRPYMSPEQLRGRPVAASDVYALAVIAHELLTGQVQFVAANDIELAERQRAGLARPPSAWRHEIPPACDDLIRRGLAFDPAARPASASELAEALAGALAPQRLGSSRPATEDGARRDRLGRTLAGLAAVVVLFAGAVTMARRWVARPDAEATAAVAATAPAAARCLEYQVIVQRYRDGKPYRSPFTLPGELLFAVDDRIRLSISSPQDGFLYLLNEGPAGDGGLLRYNVLFPSTSSRGGSPAVGAGEEVQIPTESWLAFDEEQGREKLWLVFSARRDPTLDRIGGLANPEDRGEIREVADREAVRAFLARHPEAPATRDAVRGRTTVQATGDTLVALLELEHR